MNGTEINEHNLYMTDAIMHEWDHLVPGRLCVEGYQGVRQAAKDKNMKKLHQYKCFCLQTQSVKGYIINIRYAVIYISVT